MPFRRVQDPERLHALIEAILLIESDLELSVLLRSIVMAASELIGSRYGALGVSSVDGTGLSDFITYGLTEEQRRRIGDLPAGHGLLGDVLLQGAPRRSDDLSVDERSVGFPTNHPPMKTFIGVPVSSGDGRVFGNIYLTDRLDGEPFSEEDEALLESFGRAASLIIDEVRLREQLRDLTLSEERARLARDLHDTVIQRLFAVGLSLQATLSGDLDEALRTRISSAVDDLDATIREIRTTIFEIAHDQNAPSMGLRARVLAIINEVTTRLMMPVDVGFEGAIDTRVGRVCADHVSRVLRELLTNAVRHANASRVVVNLEVTDDELRLTVRDDGIGFDPVSTSGRGLRNLTERALEVGGTFNIARHAEGGTIVTWTARRLD